jgi:hypothetical protein
LITSGAPEAAMASAITGFPVRFAAREAFISAKTRSLTIVAPVVITFSPK